MTSIIDIFYIVLTFLGSGLVTAAFLKRVFGIRKPEILNAKESLVFGFITGPVFISLLLSLLFSISPKSNNLFYFSIILLFFTVTAVISRKELNSLSLLIGKSLKKAICGKNRNWLFKIFIIIFFLQMFYQGTALPLASHDSLIYASHGKNLYEQKCFDSSTRQLTDPETGVQYTIPHFPGLPLIYTWFFILRNNTDSDFCLRAVSPIYGCLLLLLLWFLIKKRSNKYSAISGVILMTMTPLFSYQTIGNSIDPIRISLIYLSFYSLIKLIELKRFPCFILTAGITALSFFIHLGGILMIPILIILYILLFNRALWKMIILIILFASIVLMQLFIWNSSCSSHRLFYLLSLKPKFPQQISCSERSAAFGWEWSEKVKNNKASDIEIFWRERVQFFSRPHLFGITFYMALTGIIWWFFFRHRKKTLDYVLLLGMIFFALPVIYKYYINYRYISTITPGAVYFGALFFGALIISAKKKYPAWAMMLSLNAILLTGIIFFAVLFYMGIKRYPQIIPDEKQPVSLFQKITGNFKKFAAWKVYAHPMSFAMEKAFESVPENSRILFIGRLRVAYSYYSQKCARVIPHSAVEFNETSSKLKNLHQQFDFLSELNITRIIIDPAYTSVLESECSGVKLILDDKKLSELIYSRRGFKVYRLNPNPDFGSNEK